MNGSSRCNGTAEVWFRQSWEPACGALWDLRASEAVCRSLGCGRAEPLEQPVPPTPALPTGAAAGNASWAPNTTWALAPTVQCSGPEWQLCKVVEHACSSDERPVQVTCAGTSGPTRSRRRPPPCPTSQSFGHCPASCPQPWPLDPSLALRTSTQTHHRREYNWFPHRRAVPPLPPGTEICQVPRIS